MSWSEFDCILEHGYEYCFSHDGKDRRVRYKWFATDPEYIVSILKRSMFHSRRTGDGYNIVFEGVIHGYWVKKKELGYWNIGLDVTKPFVVVFDRFMNVDLFLEKYGHSARPLMYYWSRRGKRDVWDMNEVRNIVRNSDLSEKAWFVRGDKYGVVNMLLKQKFYKV